MVSGGLIGRLRTFFLGDDGRLHEVDRTQTILVGPWLRASDVQEALRSDETVDACARALYTTSAPKHDGIPYEVVRGHMEKRVRAVLRVLTGDPTDSEAAQ